MKLIKEITEDVEVLSESNESGGKDYYVRGIIMQGDIKNRNGRIYPSNVLMKEVNRYNENYVSKNRAYGELGHPKGPTINLDRVSHMFKELNEDGSNIVGKAKVLDTPLGKIVKSLIDEKACIGISSRGLGTVKENKNGIMEVQGNFMLATAGDIVADPSAPDAFVEGIMEDVDWVFDEVNGWSMEEQNKFDKLHSEIIEVSEEDVRKLEEYAIKFFEDYISLVAGKSK